VNVTICRSTQCSPYKLVFGQDPLGNFALLGEMQRLEISDEEEIPEGLAYDLHLTESPIHSDHAFTRDHEVDPESTGIDEENLPEPVTDKISEVSLYNQA